MQTKPSFFRIVPTIFILTFIFSATYGVRIGLSPIMPELQATLNFGHAAAGNLFLYISIGYAIGLFSNAFFVSRITHRKIIIVSIFSMAFSFFLLSFAQNYTQLVLIMLLAAYCAGLYLPSGFTSMTTLADKKDWNKTIAIHELSPNIAFLVIPFFAYTLLGMGKWQMVVYGWAVVCFIIGLFYVFCSLGGNFLAAPFRFPLIKTIIKKKEFWVLTIAASMCIGAEISVFAMLPLYLNELGMEKVEAGKLLTYSRLLALVLTPLGGFIADKFGSARTAFFAFFASGLFTALIGVFPVDYLLGILLFQPVFPAIFFPACFSLLAGMVNPETRSVAIALMSPTYSFIGLGCISSLIGFMGENGHFEMGFTLAGILHFLVLPFFFFVIYKKRDC